MAYPVPSLEIPRWPLHRDRVASPNVACGPGQPTCRREAGRRICSHVHRVPHMQSRIETFYGAAFSSSITSELLFFGQSALVFICRMLQDPMLQLLSAAPHLGPSRARRRTNCGLLAPSSHYLGSSHLSDRFLFLESDSPVYLHHEKNRQTQAVRYGIWFGLHLSEPQQELQVETNQAFKQHQPISRVP